MSGELSIGTLKGTITLADQFSGPIDKVAKALGISSESFRAVTGFAGLAVGAIGAATAALVTLGSRGADVADVRGAFSDLSLAAGSSADVMLGALREGTLGTISNFDLMATANKVLGSGLIKSHDDMQTLAAGAKLLADRTGGDTATAFDTLTGAMASGRTASLKQLGLFVDTKKAVEEYAAKINKLPSDLTEAEKATAISAGTIGALKLALDKAGPSSLDFRDNIDKGKVAVQNFTDDLGLAIAKSPVINIAMSGIADAIKGAFGGTQQETVKTLMGYVNQFAIFLVDAASVGVGAAGIIGIAFTEAKVIFNTVLGVLATGIGTAAGLLSDLASKASTIPGVGEAFEGVASALRTTSDFANSLGIGFDELRDKAQGSVGDQMLAVENLRDKLGALSEKMGEAAGAEVDLSEKAKPAATNVRDLGKAAAETVEYGFDPMYEAASRFQEGWATAATQVTDRFTGLMNDITLANQTGLDQRLTSIDIARQKEIDGLQPLIDMYPLMYDQLVVLVKEKYQGMTDAAMGHFATVELAAADAGFQTRAAMQETADVAMATYNEMLASGKFTAATLQAAWDKAEKAKQAAAGETQKYTMTSHQAIVAGAEQVFGVLGQKFKAAAIAGAIISTYAAIAKSLASAPWPASLVLAAGAAAAGFANVMKIRGSDSGFAMGTPGTAFVDFGRESTIKVHDREAIVNQGQGATLGEVIADRVDLALANRDNRTAAGLDRVVEKLDRIERNWPIMMRDAILLAG
jgi:hypothetical protein